MNKNENVILRKGLEKTFTLIGQQVVHMITVQLILLVGLMAAAAEPSLDIGRFKVTATDAKIMLSLSKPLSEKRTKVCLLYLSNLIGDAQPCFAPNRRTLLVTVTNLNDVPYLNQKDLHLNIVYIVDSIYDGNQPLWRCQIEPQF